MSDSIRKPTAGCSPELDRLTILISGGAFTVALMITILMESTALAYFAPVWLLGTLLVCPMLLCWRISTRARSVTWAVFLGSAGAVILWHAGARLLRLVT